MPKVGLSLQCFYVKLHLYVQLLKFFWKNSVAKSLFLLLGLIKYGLFSVLADANFPSSSVCKSGPEEIRADGKYKTYNMTYNTLPFIYHATISHHILPPCILYHNTVYVYHISICLPYTIPHHVRHYYHTTPYRTLPQLTILYYINHTILPNIMVCFNPNIFNIKVMVFQSYLKQSWSFFLWILMSKNL